LQALAMFAKQIATMAFLMGSTFKMILTPSENKSVYASVVGKPY